MIDMNIYHIDMLLYLLQESTGSTIPIEEYKEVIYAARDYRDKLIRERYG